LENKEY